MKNALDKFIELRKALVNEKAALEARLKSIEEALAGGLPVAAKAAAGVPGVRKGFKKIRNPMSLRAAVTQVTKAKPLTKPEILAAIAKLGYRFTTKSPLNSLNVVLYSKNRFKKANGKFSPA
jgi:hypothetical protein